MAANPKSKQNSAIPFQFQELEAGETLAIEVDSSAKIGGVVRSVFQDTRGVLWVGGEGDLLRNDGKTITSYAIKDDQGKEVTIKRIIEDKEGSIWCGTTHKGICRYDGKTFTNFTEDGVVDGDEVWCVHEDQAGNIWFSGKQFGVYRYDSRSFIKFDEKDGLTTPGIMCIFDDDKGRLWLGGVGGLFRYDGESFFNVKKDGPWQ